MTALSDTRSAADGLRHLNSLAPTDAEESLLRCLGSHRWSVAMTSRRPFGSLDALLVTADACADELDRDDWLEAFSHHPRIGDVDRLRERYGATATWSEGEQRGVAGADEDVLRALAECNRTYDQRFGHIFLVCASGRSAAEMLALLRERLDNEPPREFVIACGEQRKITRVRLERLVMEGGGS